MKRFKKRSLAMFMVLCMTIASVPQAIFATDYDNHWAKNAIAKWSEKGLVVGYEDGTFRPSNAITRGELAAILVRVFDYSEKASAKEYIDVDEEKWYAGSIDVISSAKLMNDGEDTFRPEDPATREEAAYAIAKAYKVTGRTGEAFVDQANISDWASASVDALYSNGFVSGNPDGTFAPQRTLTRADVVAMLDKITSELINLAGTYTQDVNGNLVVNTRDVILKDMTIKGNLYLTEGIGDGDVTLDNITVEGETFVNGGGLNSIKSKNSKFYKDMKVSAKNPVRIVIEGDAVKIEAFPGTTVTLTGNFSDVILPPGVNVVIKDATVARIFVQPGFADDKDVPKAVITIEEGSTVKDIQADAPVETKGKGKIETLTVNSEGVKTEQKPGKTDVKNKEIKVEIAGKEETQESIVNEKPASTPSGGGSSSGSSKNDDSVTPASKYYISGKATDENGIPLKNIYVEAWEPKENGFFAGTKTDENGNYSILVPGKKTYSVGATIVDEERFGYQHIVEDVLVNANKKVDLKLEKVDVANVLVVDKKGNPIQNTRLVELWNGEESGGNWTDHEGYATIFLWDRSDFVRNFNVYVDDVLMSTLAFDKAVEDFRTNYTVVLDLGLEQTITGKAVFTDGTPAAGVWILLQEIYYDEESGYERSEVKDGTYTDAQGNYSFTIEDLDANYIINSRYSAGENHYLAKELNALMANKQPLEIKQSYSIDISVTDELGLGIADAQIRIIDKNGSHTTRTSYDGTATVFYYYLVPGEYVVEITAGDKVITKDLTIQDGDYNYNLDFKFKDIAQKTLTVQLKNAGKINVGGSEIKMHNVTLSKSSEYGEQPYAEFDKTGKATLVVPHDYVGTEATIYINALNNNLIATHDVAIDAGTIEIDLEGKLIRRNLSVDMFVTTDSAIGFTSPQSIDVELEFSYRHRGEKITNKKVESVSDNSGTYHLLIENLITGTYTLSITSRIDDGTLPGYYEGRGNKIDIILGEDHIWGYDGYNKTEYPEDGIEIDRERYKLIIKLK